MEKTKRRVLELLLNSPTPIERTNLANEVGAFIDCYQVIQDLGEVNACVVRGELIYPNASEIRRILSQQSTAFESSATPAVKVKRPKKIFEQVALKHIGIVYRSILRRIGKQLNDSLDDRTSVDVGSQSFSRGLNSPNSGWDVSNMIGGCVGWHARSQSLENDDNSFASVWATRPIPLPYRKAY